MQESPRAAHIVKTGSLGELFLVTLEKRCNNKINEFAIQNVMPDITVHLDLPAAVGITRKKNQAELDRMELETLSFHESVADGYRELAKMSPDRIYTIDATQPAEDIHKLNLKKLESML